MERVKSYIPGPARRILGRLRRMPARCWAKWHASNMNEFAESLNIQNWKLTTSFSDKCNNLKNLHSSNLNPSGPGAIDLLYFLTLTTKPTIIVETGVAAGWSSLAFLEAININGRGFLYSSDLPNQFAVSNNIFTPLIVPESLKVNWYLDLRGDEIALNCFIRQFSNIDIFHYDSDKSVQGRTAAFDLIRPLLCKGSIIIYDDIDENLHFANLVRSLAQDFYVFQSGNKYIGMIFCNDNISKRRSHE